jgi:hypothetical protein
MIIGQRLSTKQFTWFKEDRTFCADVSALGLSSFSPVWDDDTYLGFVLVSSKTGKEIVCVLMDTVRDRKGDILHWRVVPLVDAKDLFTIKIFND